MYDLQGELPSLVLQEDSALQLFGRRRRSRRRTAATDRRTLPITRPNNSYFATPTPN